MPLLDDEKLLGALLSGGSGNGGCAYARANAIMNLRYRDLRHLISQHEDINKKARGESLHGSGEKTSPTGQKRTRYDDNSNDMNEDEEQELATQAKHAKLFEYYNTYKEQQEERLHAMLKVDNPLKK